VSSCVVLCCVALCCAVYETTLDHLTSSNGIRISYSGRSLALVTMRGNLRSNAEGRTLNMPFMAAARLGFGVGLGLRLWVKVRVRVMG
jgi:hypothetical protein